MRSSDAERLPPRLHPSVRTLLERHAELVRELTDGLGSPLHLLLPEVFEENARALLHTLASAGVEGRVLFAKKANKARSFVQRAAALGLGVDVASAAELEQALAAGVRGEHVGVSGAAKLPALIELGLRHGAWLAVDSCEELHHIVERARSLQLRARVLLRCRPDPVGQVHSRFGLTVTERTHALRICVEQQKHVKLEGFSFHLTGYSAAQRAAMADVCIELCLQARALDLDCHAINIGGGLAVSYVEASDWEQFCRTRADTDFHAHKQFGSFYPYATAVAGAGMLETILATTVSGELRLCDKLVRHRIQLLLEPGRSLLDQAGVSAFRIQGVKDRHASEGYAILTAEGMSFSLSEQWFDSEYLPAPLLLQSDAPGPRTPFRACVGGSSCLESDMLSWRKITFERRVQVGDIIVYANAAGYQMDSNESPFHEQPLPRKVVVTLATDRARWRLDCI